MERDLSEYVFEEVKSELRITGEKLRVGKNATDEVINNKLIELEDDCVVLLESFKILRVELVDSVPLLQGYIDLRSDMLRYQISKYIAESGNLVLRNDTSNKIYGLSLHDKFVSRLNIFYKNYKNSVVNEDGSNSLVSSIFGISEVDNKLGLGRILGFYDGRY